jgi:hypothetical protein
LAAEVQRSSQECTSLLWCFLCLIFLVTGTELAMFTYHPNAFKHAGCIHR